jgi:hypothetical protein
MSASNTLNLRIPASQQIRAVPTQPQGRAPIVGTVPLWERGPMLRLLPVAVLAAAALALSAGPAAAAPVVVAGASPGATLSAEDTRFGPHEELTVTLTGPADAGDPDDFTTSSGEEPPLWPDEVVLASETLPSPEGTTRILVGGATSAAAASVELRFDDGRTLRLPTLDSSAYQGKYAGLVRFFLGEITVPDADVDDDPAQVRMFDAAGAVIGVFDSPDVTRLAHITRTRAARTLIRFDAVLTSRLAPLPFAPEHRTDGLCLRIDVGPTNGEDAICQTPEPLRLGGWRGCGRVPTSLAGFVPAATRTLELRLGSGRTVRVPTRPTPFGRGDRVVTAVLPRGEAIRTAAALDAGGRPLVSGRVAAAPPDRRCERPVTTENLDSWFFISDAPTPQLGTPPGTEVAAELPGGPRLLVRDAGDNLCVGIERLPVDDADCDHPPFDSHDDYLYVDPRLGIVAGVYAVPVSAVDLEFLGGGTARIPATAGLQYSGRYRDAVRFALAPIPAGRTVTGARLLDAAGRQIGEASPYGPGSGPRLVRPLETVLSAGAARVVVGATRSPLSARRYPCFALALGSTQPECDDYDFGQQEVTAVSRCAPRRTVVFGLARPAVQHVRIRLSNGRTVEPRMASFPAGLNSRAKVFLAVLGPHVAVTRVQFGRHRSAGTTMPTVPPAAQCGYEVERFVD